MNRKLCFALLATVLIATACASTTYSTYALSDSDGKLGVSADFDDFSGLSYRPDADTYVDVNVSGGTSRNTVPTGKMLIDFYASSRIGMPVGIESSAVEFKDCSPIADGPQTVANYRSSPFGVRTETRWTLELPAVPPTCRFQLPSLHFGDRVWSSPWISAQRRSTSRMWTVSNPTDR